MEVDLRLPSKELAGLGYIGLPLLRIIRRKWLEDNLSLGVDDVLDGIGEFENGVFSGVSDVDGAHVVAVHEANKSINLIVYITEATSLVALPVDGDRLVTKGLDNEVANNTTVVLKHTRTICIKDTCDADLKVVLAMILHAKSFRDTFAFIVAGADTDWVNISPVLLHLRVHLGISVDFGSGCDEESGLASLGQTKHVDGTEHVGLDGLDGIVLIENGGSRTGKMVHLVDFQIDRVNDIMANELETGVSDMLVHVGLLPREAVVDTDHLVELILQEAVNEVRANETRTTGNKDPRNRAGNVTGVKHDPFLVR
mmetsp:Transcript_14834/g.28216  ORF Transcript_14834/g.28216 Transcript_14834/m.28216 type:complete len:312 (+) Transcript_14834:442-1377(+)